MAKNDRDPKLMRLVYPELSIRVARALWYGNVKSRAEVMTASDADLVRLTGIDEGYLAEIRAVLPHVEASALTVCPNCAGSGFQEVV